MSLERITDAMHARLPALAGLGYRVKFEIADTGVVLVDARTPPPTLSHDDGEADCTIRLDAARAEQLLRGELSPTLAYSLGQIRIEGSLGVALKLASLLDE